jgi:hypothetical protein
MLPSRCLVWAPGAMRGTIPDFYEVLQLHFAPQLQASPQPQPVRRFALVSWQPHLQVAPAQDAHLQTFELFTMRSSFEVYV